MIHANHSLAFQLRLACLHNDTTALCALCDLHHDSELIMRPGESIFIIGPLDFAIGIVDCVDGSYIRLLPGCVTFRDIPNQTELLKTGKPSGVEYTVHPAGHNVAIMSVTGYSPIPEFKTKDWPARTR